MLLISNTVLLQFFRNKPLLKTMCASSLGGVAVTAVMTPFDVVSTRLYNQGVNEHGKGILYTGVIDCFKKVLKKEGVWGFYKGWGPQLMRLGPHSVLSLTFWDLLKKAYSSHKDKHGV